MMISLRIEAETCLKQHAQGYFEKNSDRHDKTMSFYDFTQGIVTIVDDSRLLVHIDQWVKISLLLNK